MSLENCSYLELWQTFCSAERNFLCDFVKGHYEKQICEIILNLDQWFQEGMSLNTFHILSSGSPFVRRSGTFCAILVKGFMRNNSVELFEFGPVVQE